MRFRASRSPGKQLLQEKPAGRLGVAFKLAKLLEAELEIKRLGLKVERVEKDADALPFTRDPLRLSHKPGAEPLASHRLGHNKVFDEQPIIFIHGIKTADDLERVGIPEKDSEIRPVGQVSGVKSVVVPQQFDDLAALFSSRLIWKDFKDGQHSRKMGQAECGVQPSMSFWNRLHYAFPPDAAIPSDRQIAQPLLLTDA